MVFADAAFVAHLDLEHQFAAVVDLFDHPESVGYLPSDDLGKRRIQPRINALVDHVCFIFDAE